MSAADKTKYYVHYAGNEQTFTLVTDEKQATTVSPFGFSFSVSFQPLIDRAGSQFSFDQDGTSQGTPQYVITDTKDNHYAITAKQPVAVSSPFMSLGVPG